ncbi:hypothetical protein [Pantoea phytobeneficialis]|uniref:Uncharacterized protein n=1 Tax=Pantoea phytobeneficialis TaxID=2052056 RepID=A0AAP9KRX1_9GAMM|nr:hypothetical protein [Pantoea phytobeneficialis]MDO6406466.1 hypothetical protein [Pantoea phytobeneficialis]QGR09566.1 hypothetical protein CTZ24_24155 [Pantoea phytobeneficialis]
MKIIIFFAILIAGVLLIPDSVIGSLVDHLNIIQGDGEEGMNNFDFTVLIIKLVISVLVALFVLSFFRKSLP